MRRVGIEFRQSYQRRVAEGFIQKYLSGDNILDIGYRGGDPEAVPVTENAIGIDSDYPGYDGVHLPFPDKSQDAVFASHILEHVPEAHPVLVEWDRVLKVGGYLVIFVPHRDLYERRPDLPSLWNADHRRFYTPASLLTEVEAALPVNGFRIRHLADNDWGFDYSVAPAKPPRGCYEIELILQKIERPAYSDYLRLSEAMSSAIRSLDSFFILLVEDFLCEDRAAKQRPSIVPNSNNYITPWRVVRERFLTLDLASEEQLRRILRPLLESVSVDLGWYTSVNPDLAEHPDPAEHWRSYGFFEGRLPRDFWPVNG